MLTKEQKEAYNKLCTPSAERDPNTGKLVPNSEHFKKPDEKPEEKKK